MKKIYSLLLIVTPLFSCAQSYVEPTEDEHTKKTNPTALQTIPLELTTDKREQNVFVEGDELQWLVSLGSDAYLYMYHIDSLNNVIQLLPSVNQESNFYPAGYFQTIPEYDNGYRFIIGETFGSEVIWIIASDKLIAMDVKYASIDDVKMKIKTESRAAYGEISYTISTIKK